jgi:hypothetical protein
MTPSRQSTAVTTASHNAGSLSPEIWAEIAKYFGQSYQKILIFMLVMQLENERSSGQMRL